MNPLERELETMRGFATCRGDDDRLDEADAELARLRGIEEAAAEAAAAAAGQRRTAGAVPLGHPAQQLPLRGGAPGQHCRQRTRCRFLHALGFWHETRPV